MTVQELIAELQKMPANLPVVISLDVSPNIQGNADYQIGSVSLDDYNQVVDVGIVNKGFWSNLKGLARGWRDRES